MSETIKGQVQIKDLPPHLQKKLRRQKIVPSLKSKKLNRSVAGNPSVNYAGATIVTHLLDYGSTRLDMGYASAIATILFLLMVGTNKIIQKLLGRVGE